MTDHPDWCDPDACRATDGGNHQGASIQVESGAMRATVLFEQGPRDDDLPQMMLRLAYRGVEATAPVSIDGAADLARALTGAAHAWQHDSIPARQPIGGRL
jgi:hypothetical protein